MIRFEKSLREPIVPRTPETFYSIHAANPDVLEFGDDYLFFFRGQDERGHDEIGLGRCAANEFDGRTWDLPIEPAIRVSDDASSFDSGHILDPAAALIGGKIQVYYTAHRADWSSWNIPSFIGMAESDDGVRFTKHGDGGLIEGMAPEIVVEEDSCSLFFQRIDNRRISIFRCVSPDGLRFDESNVHRVLEPSDQGWDAASLSTARICRESDVYFMFYGGCGRWPDYPEAIGLARSTDLVNWERYPGNPVLERGAPGDWDEGALWFATVEHINGVFHLWYEGVGSDPVLSGQTRTEASRRCREEDYGGYADTAFSQIGHATFSGTLIENW